MRGAPANDLGQSYPEADAPESQAHEDNFAVQREELPDGSIRVTLPWAGESILIEALDRRIGRGVIELGREPQPDGTERTTYRNVLP
ncbi:MAG: hypothetical protein ACLQU1_14150 [Bryobacteraceae bacterium]